MKFTKFFLVAILSVCLSGTIHAQKTEIRKIGQFDQLEVFGNMSVILVKGEQEGIKIEVEGESDISTGDVSTSLDGLTLKVNTTVSLFKASDKITVYVTFKKLRSISAKASADIRSKELLQGDKLELVASKGGNIYLDADVNTLDAKVTQGSVIVLDGYAKTQVVTASLDGTYSGFKFTCDNTYVKANTKGIAKVVADKYLEASAVSGGYIGYGGDVKKTDISEKLGGKVEKVELEVTF